MVEKKVSISYDWTQGLDSDLPDTPLLKKILNKFYELFITENYIEFEVDRDEIESFLSTIENYELWELLNEIEKDQIDSLQSGLKTIDARNNFSMGINQDKKIAFIINQIKMFQITKNPKGITIEEICQNLKGLIDSPRYEIAKIIKGLYVIECVIYMPVHSTKRYKFIGRLPSISDLKEEFPDLFFTFDKVEVDT